MMNINDKLAFGGLLNLDKNSVAIREQQILDGYRIHTCYFYNQSLDVIKEASKQVSLTPILTTKVYYNFRENSNKGRHKSVLKQVELIIERLGFIPRSWNIQLCNIQKINQIESDDFFIFKEKLEANFGPTPLFIESFIPTEKAIIQAVDKGLVDGITFKESAFESKSTYKLRAYLKGKNIKYSTYGFLSGISDNYINENLNSTHREVYDSAIRSLNISNPLDINISYLKSQMKLAHYSYGVTAVSSMKNYNDLINRVKTAKTLSQNQLESIEKVIQTFQRRLSLSNDYRTYLTRKSSPSDIAKHPLRLFRKKIQDLLDAKSWI